MVYGDCLVPFLLDFSVDKYSEKHMVETEHLNSLWSIMSENNRKKVIRVIELMME
ncbi:MAG: hypothetical protein GX300_01730 [Tissierellia bacterium]|nr:hypothetical protein [Tissierellia bacterium]